MTVERFGGIHGRVDCAEIAAGVDILYWADGLPIGRRGIEPRAIVHVLGDPIAGAGAGLARTRGVAPPVAWCTQGRAGAGARTKLRVAGNRVAGCGHLGIGGETAVDACHRVEHGNPVLETAEAVERDRDDGTARDRPVDGILALQIDGARCRLPGIAGAAHIAAVQQVALDGECAERPGRTDGVNGAPGRFAAQFDGVLAHGDQAVRLLRQGRQAQVD